VCEKYDLGAKQFGEEAQSELLRYGWPGNIRELISVCERAAILSEGDAITKEDLFIQSREGTRNIQNMERDLLVEVLDETDGDLAQAATLLATSEEDLAKKMKKYNL